MTFLLGQQTPGADELYDIVVLEPVPPIWPTVFWSILGVLILAAIGVAIWYYLKRSEQTGGDSSVAKVKSRFLEIEKNRIEYAPNQFTLAISDALKDYLSEKFNDPVRFETSEEFLKRTSDTKSKLPAPARDLLRLFLSETDELKFGNKGGGDAKLIGLLLQADNVVNVCERESAKKEAS
ncbi:hypothetical protein N9B21_01505 [Verrucomicrobiales bacterium]|nr:hypothetical protein [Verrucomicrobiales bacterium]MDA7926694.1 hypothetical protein [Verrucomicrobiales bacterium]